MHVKNIQKLATEMFKISKNFSAPPMSELFHQRVNHYDLRNPYESSISKVNSVFHGQGSTSYLLHGRYTYTGTQDTQVHLYGS